MQFVGHVRDVRKNIINNEDLIAVAMIKSEYPKTSYEGYDPQIFLRDIRLTAPCAQFSYAYGKKEDVINFIKNTPGSMPMYELFYNDMRVRPYFDIDKTTVSRLKKICDFLIVIYRDLYGLTEKDINDEHIIICARQQSVEHSPALFKYVDFTSNEKDDDIFISAHIIINNGMYHRSLIELERIVWIVNQNIMSYYSTNDQALGTLDALVYKCVQLMRLPYKAKQTTDDCNKYLYPFSYRAFFGQSKEDRRKLEDYLISRPTGKPFEEVKDSNMLRADPFIYALDRDVINNQIYKYAVSKLTGARFTNPGAALVLCRTLKTLEDSFRMKLFFTTLFKEDMSNADRSESFSSLIDGEGTYDFDRITIWDRVVVGPNAKNAARRNWMEYFDSFFEQLNNSIYMVEKKKIKYTFTLVKPDTDKWAKSVILGDPNSLHHINAFFKLNTTCDGILASFNSGTQFKVYMTNKQINLPLATASDISSVLFNFDNNLIKVDFTFNFEECVDNFVYVFNERVFVNF
jgi:hypothetical protein